MNTLRILLAAASAALIAACGGGTGGTGVSNPQPVTNAVSIGVMTKGSVIVNGVHFEDNTATIIIDDTPKTAQIDTHSGMVVKVLGSVNADGVTGNATRVRALVEVRGTPTSINAAASPQSLVVLGQTVFVDDQTIYSNLPNGFTDITTSTLIEVHGLRDSAGNIRATRIEANQAQMGDANVDEIRGVVSGGTGTNPITFSLGSQTVALTGGATIVPTGATYQNGSVVEVHCSARPCVVASVFQASVIEVENADDAAFQPGVGERFEVEGLVSGFTAHPGTFFVAGTSVTTTNSTRFEGGVATDLANDIQIEAEGTFTGTTLLATKIEFKRSVIRLQGATANATATSFDVLIANGTITVKVEVDSQTTGVIPADGTACAQVRGQRQSQAGPVVVLAGEIIAGCTSGNRSLIQAPVEAENGITLTLLGFPIDVAPTDAPPFEDANGQPLTPQQFFDAVTPASTDANGVSHAGTLVKVTFNNNAVTVHQAEIEDD